MSPELEITVMSGLEDGQAFNFSSENGDGNPAPDRWTISIGRGEENDICLPNDTYISRKHAYIHWKDGRWWLEDINSTNGTAVEILEAETRVKGIVPLMPGQLFRVGRTWMRIEPEAEPEE